MKKLITLTMVLALAAAFTTGCKKAEAPKAEAPKIEAPKVEAVKPVMAPMSAKKVDAAKPADAAIPAAPEKK